MERSLAIDFVIIIIVLYSFENNTLFGSTSYEITFFSTKISIDYIQH